jgi:hypothetical protein
MRNKNAEQKTEQEAEKPIVLESNVGLCGLRISATMKQNAEAVAKILGFFLWHDGASAVFGGGKKAKFGRETPYSNELGEHAIAVLGKVLAPYFDVQSIETFAHTKATEEQKFMKFCKSLGMSEEQASAGWKTAQAAKAEEKPAEAKAEVVLQ